MDVRLLGGLAATAPARLLARARNFAFAALAGMAMTGAVLFSAEASHLAVNRAFQLKAVLVAAGLVNIAVYELWARRAVERLEPGAPMPARAKIAGLLSLGIWVAVAACGRSIAYF
jgi:NADH:ubiquinone oxidoreductase subunit 4 (subunit M)